MSLYNLIDRMLEPPEEKRPICPVCGKDCDTVYKDAHGDICGCDRCIEMRDAWEEPECFPDE